MMTLHCSVLQYVTSLGDMLLEIVSVWLSVRFNLWGVIIISENEFLANKSNVKYEQRNPYS